MGSPLACTATSSLLHKGLKYISIYQWLKLLGMTLSFIPMIASILLIKNPYFEEQGLESVSDVIASSACFDGNHASFLKKIGQIW